MSCWPLEIEDGEPIVRAIISPYHVRNGKVRSEAYDPQPNTDEVSVMRAAWIGADECKRHAASLAKPPNSSYQGLAILSASQIRGVGVGLIDDRQEFPGHACIKHHIRKIRGDPGPPEEVRILRERAKKLAGLARYLPDPSPEKEGWSGPALEPNPT